MTTRDFIVRMAIFTVFITLFTSGVSWIVTGEFDYWDFKATFAYCACCTFFCSILIRGPYDYICKLPRPVFFFVFLLLAVLGVGVFGYRYFARSQAGAPPNLMCVTLACGYQTRRQLRVGDVLPLRCPRCGQRSVYGTHICKRCGTAVVLNRQRGIDRSTFCPQCGQEVRRD